MRILELFAGIGGVAAAVAAEHELHAEIVAAIDIETVAKSVYEANFPWPYRIAEIASLSVDTFAVMQADVWWMSPPCLPFSIRGLRKDLHDTRNQAFLHLIEVIASIRPAAVVIENVPGFEASETCKLLLDRLASSGYHSQIHDVCPTQFGWCNKRRRIYVVAWQRSRCTADRIDVDMMADESRLLKSIIDRRINRESHSECYLDDDVVQKYSSGLDRLTMNNVEQSAKPTACFAASYGKTYLHAGSYLVAEDGVRRFSPQEMKRQLGFDASFVFPESIDTRTAWRLLGSSLSIPVVRRLLKAVHATIDLS